MMKIGRRGSLTAFITAQGVQGHSAYPHRAKNPLSALVALLDRLATQPLDQGTAHFNASTLAITTIDTGNAATNVIPATAKATVNIRFNDTHSSQDLITWLEKQALQQSANSQVEFEIEAVQGRRRSKRLTKREAPCVSCLRSHFQQHIVAGRAPY